VIDAGTPEVNGTWIRCVVPARTLCGRRRPRRGCSAAKRDRPYAVERGHKLARPWPGRGKSEPVAPTRSCDGAGRMQEAAAKPFRFGARELALEAQKPCPSKQVLSDETHDEPARVDGEGLRGELAHPGVLPVADAVLGSTATAIERLEIGDVGVFEIGQADLETVAVDVGKAQLGAGMRLLAPGDRPRPLRPAKLITTCATRPWQRQVCLLAAVIEAVMAIDLAAAKLTDLDLGDQVLSARQAVRELERLRMIRFVDPNGEERQVVTRPNPLQASILTAFGVGTFTWRSRIA
jgi:hypothetical protein